MAQEFSTDRVIRKVKQMVASVCPSVCSSIRPFAFSLFFEPTLNPRSSIDDSFSSYGNYFVETLVKATVMWETLLVCESVYDTMRNLWTLVLLMVEKYCGVIKSDTWKST